MGLGRKILFVTRALDPVGTGRQVELAAEGLAAAGFDVAVAITTCGGDVASRLADRGITVHAVGRRPVVDAAAMARLATFRARFEPETLLGFGRSAALPLLTARLLGARCRTLLWLGLPPRRASTIQAAKRLDGVIATSPGVASACTRSGIRADRIIVVPPGITRDAGRGLSREDIAARIGLDPTKQWTLAVAPLEPEPRLQRLLWAIDQLGVVRKDLQHVLIGAGPLLGQIGRRARAQELAERLIVLPSCNVLPDLLTHVKIVWQSGSVALGGALLDGMAHGLPTVAVESDAARQLVVDDVTGRVVPALPESEFPRRAFNIVEDDDLARRYGDAAAARAATEFPVEPFVEGIVAAVRARPLP
jgi:glycosyltransferase involved in cell wall biosynthesis